MPELDERQPDEDRPNPSDPTKQDDRGQIPGSKQSDQEEQEEGRDQSEVTEQGGRARDDVGQNPDRSPNVPE
jgi:hypothetical protein